MVRKLERGALRIRSAQVRGIRVAPSSIAVHPEEIGSRQRSAANLLGHTRPDGLRQLLLGRRHMGAALPQEPDPGGDVSGVGLKITNQGGATHFLQRFAIQTHDAYDPVQAMRFAPVLAAVTNKPAAAPSAPKSPKR